MLYVAQQPPGSLPKAVAQLPLVQERNASPLWTITTKIQTLGLSIHLCYSNVRRNLRVPNFIPKEPLRVHQVYLALWCHELKILMMGVEASTRNIHKRNHPVLFLAQIGIFSWRSTQWLFASVYHRGMKVSFQILSTMLKGGCTVFLGGEKRILWSGLLVILVKYLSFIFSEKSCFKKQEGEWL